MPGTRRAPPPPCPEKAGGASASSKAQRGTRAASHSSVLRRAPRGFAAPQVEQAALPGQFHRPQRTPAQPHILTSFRSRPPAAPLPAPPIPPPTPPSPHALIASGSMSSIGIGMPLARRFSRNRLRSMASPPIPPVPAILPATNLLHFCIARADRHYHSYTMITKAFSRDLPVGPPATSWPTARAEAEAVFPRPRSTPRLARRGYRRRWNGTVAKPTPPNPPKWSGRRR